MQFPSPVRVLVKEASSDRVETGSRRHYRTPNCSSIVPSDRVSWHPNGHSTICRLFFLAILYCGLKHRRTPSTRHNEWGRRAIISPSKGRRWIDHDRHDALNDARGRRSRTLQLWSTPCHPTRDQSTNAVQKCVRGIISVQLELAMPSRPRPVMRVCWRTRAHMAARARGEIGVGVTGRGSLRFPPALAKVGAADHCY